jgi:ElaB/YqjD/DUF883 family membrane-anchored ribosome-binding protein
MANNQSLPEGTDTIIEGAGVDEDTVVPFESNATDDAAPTADAAPASGDTAGGTGGASSSEGVRDQLFGRYEALRGEAGDRARDFVQTGKDRATDAIDDVVRMIEDAAAEVDDKIGSQYGDYARRAAQGLESLSDAVKNKDVDELFDDARALIAKSPAAAAGIAAALGFVVARVVRSGIPDSTDGDASKA